MSEPRLNNVYTGIGLVLYGLTIFMICAIAAPSAIAQTAIIFDRPFGGGVVQAVQFSPWVTITILVGVGAIILSFVGKLMCLGAPASMEGKSVIYLAVIFEGISVVTTVIPVIAPSAVPPNLVLAGQLLSLVGFVLFVVFLRKLGEYIGSEIVVRQTGALLVLGAIIVGVLLVGVLGVYVRSAPLTIIFLLLGGLLFLFFVIFYAVILNSVRAILQEGYLDRRRDDYYDD